MSQRPTVKRDFSFGNPTVRAWLYQMAAIIAVLAIVGYLIHNTVINLANRGITSGFGFLERSAGFGIVQHLIDYTEGDTYARVFLVGLTNTLLVSALCIVFASVLGFFIGLARLSDNWLLRRLSTIYIETFRNIPPLLQIFFWYFAVLRNLPGPREALTHSTWHLSATAVCTSPGLPTHLAVGRSLLRWFWRSLVASVYGITTVNIS